MGRGTDRKTPPDVSKCIYADMEKGDAFLMLASAFHGGGANKTENEQRLVFGTFVTRGYLRQEENQFLAVPHDVARQYPRDVLEYLGYSISDPACGTVDQLDPIYALYPEWKADAKYKDF
jgi:ectoine hydroxylase-related dioxygenase (phytanoyl-CoA dioxygenase family)